MTSFAFILGCVPLWVASGAGAAARRVMGTVVVSGMLAATLLGIFFIPTLFVVVERLKSRSSGEEKTVPKDEGDDLGGGGHATHHA